MESQEDFFKDMKAQEMFIFIQPSHWTSKVRYKVNFWAEF